MKFIITAVAAVIATSNVVSGMDAPELRGPVLIESLMGSSKSSKSSSGSRRRSNRSSGSKSSKSSADLFDSQFIATGSSKSSKSSGSGPSNRSAGSSKSSKDMFDRQFIATGSSKSSKSSGSGPSNRSAGSSKSSKSSADMFDDSQFERQEEEVAIPKFFPADMSEELLDEFRRRNRNGGNPDKPNAAQKRQSQRDARRAIDNPNRSQREETAERARKTRQSENRGRGAVDPYNDRHGQRDYGARREATRIQTCERTGDSCRFSGPNSWCYNDCVDDIGSRGAARNARNGRAERVDQECASQCRFIEARCYDYCREEDSMGFCLDDCNKNIDTRSMRRRIEDRSDRDDYDRIDRCEANCRTVSTRNGRRTACFARCDDDDDSFHDFSSNSFDDICDECRDINNRNRRNNCLDRNRCF